jgi:hypothetical protein
MTIEQIISIAVALITVVAWLVRLEARTLQNEKEIQRVKDEAISFTKAVLEELKHMTTSFHELDKRLDTKFEKVMGRIEHMNTKITHLEQNKVLPIIEEYFKRENK